MSELWMEDWVYLGTFPIVAAVVHHFYNRCLGCRLKKTLYIILLYAFYCAVSSSLYLSPLPGYALLFLNITMLAVLSCFYKKGVMWRLAATVFITAVMLLSDIIAQSILSILLGGDPTAIYIMSLFFSKIIMLMLGNVAVRLCTSYGKGVLSGWYWAFLILCPFMSLMSMYGLSRNLGLREMPGLHFTLSAGLIFINYFVFMVCDHVLYKQSVGSQTQLLEQQVSYYANQYRLAEAAQKETLRFRHDFKNILVGLQAELETGRVFAGRDTIRTLIDNFSSSKGVVHSGNIAIDSIINYKQQIAAETNIPFYLDLRFPADIILDTTAISVILGNALDNAIEACKRLDSGKAYIKIQIHYHNESLFIRIENPYSGSIRTDFTGKVYSTKSDHTKHGIGLESIRDMVEKNHGLLNISFENGIFQTEVVLFNIQRADCSDNN